MNMLVLRQLLDMSFTLTFIAFFACAFYLYLERDRVPEDFRVVLRVSCVYLTIAAINYYYMRVIYHEGMAHGESTFPTSFRYVDWILTTPLMLIKFPLMLGIGERGKPFMIRLVVLDLVMVLTGYVAELAKSQAVHFGFFLIGCVAWFGILASLFSALTTLPERIGPAVRTGVRSMSLFVVIGWAIYPVGFFLPMLGLPDDVRELAYNVADLFNKVGLCLVVYFAAKSTGAERDELAAAEAEYAAQQEQGYEGYEAGAEGAE
jgi:sensory rhodopsin